MNCFLVALICAVAGSLPLIVRGKGIHATLLSVISFFILWPLLYLAVPSTVYPLWGLPGFLVFILWIISAIVDCVSEDEPTFALLFPASAVVIYFFSFIGNSAAFNARKYAELLGRVEVRVWTEDVQPKDPRHMRMVSHENAIYIAKTAVAQGGSIGSQFRINDENMTIQMIREELWHVVPFDFQGYATWSSSDGKSPGYIKVNAIDPKSEPVVVMLPEDYKLRYMPGACWEYNLERHLRYNGFLNKGLTDYSFELDDNDHPYWVVTVYDLALGWWGEKIEGVAIVDPVSGNIKFTPTNDIPEWVDRAVPQNFIKNYLAWHGKYAKGWKNSWWGSKNLTQPEDPILIYGMGAIPEWVTGITSSSVADNSLVGLYYTNSRTGKSVFYQTKGGATHEAILNAIGDFGPIKNQKLHGSDPQVYNVYNRVTAVAPVYSDNHMFQGVAFVAIDDVQNIAFGRNQYEAKRIYERIISEKGMGVVLDKTTAKSELEGVVDRVHFDPLTSSYYLHLKDVPHLFSGGEKFSPELPITEPGDRVKVGFFSSGEDVQPLDSFENFSLFLEKTQAQKELQEKDWKRREEENSEQVIRRIQSLNPAQLRELAKQIPR